MPDTHRWITDRQVAEGEEAILAASIASEGRVGVLEGVHVDFRHPDLPPEWEALPWWNVGGPPPTHAGIVFPSEASAEDPVSRKVAWLKSAEGQQLVRVSAGDRVTIESVVPKIDDARFDHPHDAQQRLAYLRIESPSGAVLRPVGPLAFYGKTQIRRAGTRFAFDHIVERICSHAGVEDLHARNPLHPNFLERVILWELPLEEMALAAAQEAHDAYFRLSNAHPEGPLSAHLRTLANYSALMGFLLAKKEGEKAERTGRAVFNNLDKARQARINPRWRSAAAKVWEAHPKWTTHRVAKEIAEAGEDLSSIQRAIKYEAPETSSSFRRKPDRA